MKTYQSHKVVEAAPIMGYTALGNYVNVEADNADGYERVSVPGDFFARGNPDLGDYLVRYAPDGYLSWSPRAVFDAGYTIIQEAKPGTGNPSPGNVWQSRAMDELEQLSDRLNLLRHSLLKDAIPDEQIKGLLQAQLKAMTAYHDALSQRLRVCGVIDTETPPVVRETVDEGGEPEFVEVTISAPAGKRANVCMHQASGPARHPETRWTVTEGQRQSWSVAADEVVTVSQADTSTVAPKRPAE